MSLEEYTDGRIAFHGPEGFNRFFQSNADGTYTPSSGDHGTLVRNPDGTFQLKEKDGFIYRFRSNLSLDYLQDLNGNRIGAIYNSSNQLSQIQHSSGKSFSLAYNAAGRIIGLTDHAGRVTTYEYDSWNLMLTRVTDPAGNVTEYTYNPGLLMVMGPIQLGTLYIPLLNFRLESIAFPDGTRVQNEYDSQARLTRQTGAWGANPIKYSYDADGTTHVTDALGGSTIIKINDKSQPLRVTTPDGAQTSYQYDASLNLTRASDPLSQVTQFSYDGFGNVTQITNPLSQAVQLGYDLRFNKPSSITNPLGKTTSFAYDSKGNLRTITYPDASSEGYDYDSTGNLISNTDAAGKMTVYSYNNQGQVTSLQNALGDSTQFSYNTASDLQNVTDAKGHVISHTRDTLGRLIQRTYPDTSLENYEYDAAGKVTAFTNRRGERISFSYDVTGRLERKTYPSGKALHFLYDGAGYLASVEQVTGSTITLDTAYERDALHRITKAKVPGKVYPESYDVSYAYDAAGKRIFMSYPDGYGLNYAYDAANRLIRISDASNSTIVAYEYDAAGRRIKRTLGNGTYTTYQYDDLDRLTALINYSPGGAVQSGFAYTYNAAGIRTSMTTLEGVHNYTYDNTYQLIGVSYPDSRTVNYDFDEVGNRKSITDNGALTIYSSNALDQYTQIGSESFSYDMDGNLTSRVLSSNSTAYGWDEDDRLVSVDRNGVHIDYRYDYQGRLIAKAIGGQETRYIWDGINLVAEVDSTGTIIKRYVFGASIDEVIVVTANGANSWLQLDGLGSAVGMTDNGGTVVGTGSYDAYGNPRSGTLRRFAGMRWDEDSNLYYVKERWYEPRLGRFISEDKYTQLIPHHFSYCENNPINKIDPWGLSSLPIPPLSVFAEGLQSGADEALISVIKGGLDLQSLYDAWKYLTGGSDWQKAWTAGNLLVGLFLGASPAGAIWTGATNLIDLGWAVGVTSEAKFGQWKAEQHLQYLDNARRGLPVPNPLNERRGWVYFGFLHGYIWVGGMCPTFVQPPAGMENAKLGKTCLDVSREDLGGKITVPIEGCLLRSDIPIFGVAGGKDFEKYRVEYGRGSNPLKWYLIEESDKTQERAPDFKDISWMQGDLDLKGNLATWNTGLKNWSHLPWHAPEDPTDLNGVYALRLTVFSKNGEKAEDRIQVEVGRAIPQCLSGIAISPDKRVIMRFPEQALTHPFRVYTILPLRDVGDETPAIAKGFELIGQAYRVREPGDRFIKDVSLEFSAGTEDIGNRKPEHIGIGRYDAVKNEWVLLSTTYEKKSAVFSTTLTELPSPKAIYALMCNAESKLSSPAQPPPSPPAPLKPVRPGVLVDDTFESDMGTVKQRDRIVGAMLSRDNNATPDGSYCLKFTNQNHGGNFSSTVIDQPFDVREYGIMGFDYRIGPGVKVDFFLKVNGRWYNLRFTGDPVDFRNRDVNIANFGEIEGVIADDKWHTASVDLGYLLGRQTHHTRIEEIVMANWNVGGYMKLEFGNNARNATYYLDNFKLIGTGPIVNPPAILLVDDFNDGESKNKLGGGFGAYCTPGTRYVDASLMEVSYGSGGSLASSATKNQALVLNFDTTKPDSYGGYWTSIAGADITSYTTLAFRLHGDREIPNVIVGIRNKNGIEGKTNIRPYALPPDASGWRDVRIPMSGLRGLSEFSSPDVLFFSFSYRDGSGKGIIKIDDLRFEHQPFQRVADFESPFAWNLLGGDYATFANGAASISASSMKDMESPSNMILRISYGGTIGRDYGPNGGFSFAGWRTGLQGIDARPFSHLIMRMRGEKGKEIPNFYLSDSARRIPLRAKEMPDITTEWQTVRLSLDHYVKQGIDLSHLESMEIVFEWVEQSGTIYVDDIGFE